MKKTKKCKDFKMYDKKERNIIVERNVNYASITEDSKVTSCLLSLSTRVVSANANPGG